MSDDEIGRYYDRIRVAAAAAWRKVHEAEKLIRECEAQGQPVDELRRKVADLREAAIDAGDCGD